ncbi:MAG: flippase [Deltaproteobacteria bacterium]|nr:flippase [Deltaproteobacteria bacterium]
MNLALSLPKRTGKKIKRNSSLFSLSPDARSYVLNLAAQFLGRTISISAQLLVFLLVARKLGATELGRFAYFLTFVNVLAALSDFGTGETASKDLSQLPDDIRSKYWGNVIIIRIISNLLFCFIGIFAAHILRKDMAVELILGALSVPVVSSRIFDPVFQIYGRPWYASAASGFYGMLYLIGIVMLFLVGKATIFRLGLIYALSNAFYVIAAFLFSKTVLKPLFKPDKKLVLRNLKTALPIGISTIFITINSRADTFMLAWLRNDREVGLYNAAYKLVDTALIIMVLLTNPLVPILSRMALRGRDVLVKHSRRILGLMCIVFPPVPLLTPLFSKQLMVFLYGRDYLAAARALNILSWVCFLICFSMVTSVLCLAINLVYFEWWNAALAAATNVVLNYLWIPQYGFIGSCWATLVCELLLLTVTSAYLFRTIKGIFNPLFLAYGLFTIGSWIFLGTRVFSKSSPWIFSGVLLLLYVFLWFIYLISTNYKQFL